MLNAFFSNIFKGTYKGRTGLRENQIFNYLFVPALLFSAQLCK